MKDRQILGALESYEKECEDGDGKEGYEKQHSPPNSVI